MNNSNIIQQKKQMNTGINSIQYIFWFIYLFVSIYEGYISASIGSITRYFLITWIVFMVLNVLKKKSLRVNKFILMIILWLFYYYFTLLWTNTLSQAMLYIGTISTMVFLYVLLLQFRYDIKLINFILSVYKWFSVSLAILAIFNSVFIGAGTRKVLVLFGSYIDPNNQVALMGIGAALCLFSHHKKSRVLEIINKVAFMISVYAILQTGSRSGVVILLSVTLIWVLLESKDNKKEKNIFKRILLIIGLIVVIWLVLFPYLPESVIERLLGTGNLKFTDGTEREIIWAEGMRIFSDNILFGNGWGAYESHNTFITFLIDGGIFGSIPLVAIIFSIIRKSLKMKNTAALLVLITGILPAVFIGAQNKRFFWNAIIFSTIILISNNKEREVNYDAANE